MNSEQVNTITRDGIKSVIKNLQTALNARNIDQGTYEATLDVLCNTHGTEYIADIFVEMTKAGEL